jgi:outer membrane protein assembly factor BamD (BamD/ComL family)
MIKRWNRRRQYRDVITGDYDPFTGLRRKVIKVREVNPPRSADAEDSAITQKEGKIIELRSEIAKRIAQRNLPAAAEIYLELTKLDSSQVLPRQHLLDIANQFASDKMSSEAAQAYERFIAHYSNYEQIAQVELMLGILYSRYLNHRDLAIKHLQAAAEKLTESEQLKMCKDELARLQKN